MKYLIPIVLLCFLAACKKTEDNSAHFLKHYGDGLDYRFAKDMIATGDGCWLVLGHKRDGAVADVDHPDSVFIFKMDNTGKILWQKSYSPDLLLSYPVKILKGAGDFYFTLTNKFSDPKVVEALQHRSILAKIDLNGEVLDTAALDLASNLVDQGFFPYYTGADMCLSEDNKPVVLGTCSNVETVFYGADGYTDKRDVYIAKFNDDLSVAWELVKGLKGLDFGEKIIATPYGYAAAAYMDLGDTPAEQQEWDPLIYIHKIASNGTFLSSTAIQDGEATGDVLEFQLNTTDASLWLLWEEDGVETSTLASYPIDQFQTATSTEENIEAQFFNWIDDNIWLFGEDPTSIVHLQGSSLEAVGKQWIPDLSAGGFFKVLPIDGTDDIILCGNFEFDTGTDICTVVRTDKNLKSFFEAK